MLKGTFSDTYFTVIIFHCADREGFIPNHTFSSVYTTEGKWQPDPADYKCTVEPITKGIVLELLLCMDDSKEFLFPFKFGTNYIRV